MPAVGSSEHGYHSHHLPQAYQGLLLGSGDTDVVTVQDKLILSTGRHPLAPYLLMDLSYTQQKAAYDHRIGIDNFMFGAANLCTYLARPGEGSRMSRIFICPQPFPFPIVDAVSQRSYSQQRIHQPHGVQSGARLPRNQVLRNESSARTMPAAPWSMASFSTRASRQSGKSC